ncbi:hypothetical protein [Enterococcus sp. CSURQ0835]|uniref:hypothetical protein n=1 Tax=Enterococcus sp. CSURQ0835 TaxID=2681394 RepID=UPI00135791C2|nr:hypothetical protein [Enterococcus sp. CSURQ0835]
MADIRDLGIFNTNKGMAAIKKESATIKDNPPQKNKVIPSPTPSETIRKKQSKRRVGAPIKNHDRAFVTSQPIKLSALLNSMTRVMVEKYETSLTKDDLLRKALDFYIKQNLTKEDKIDLLRDVSRDLDAYRSIHPTIPLEDDYGIILKSTDEIEKETLASLKERWGLENNR